MQKQARPISLAETMGDLRTRTLAKLPGEVAKLVYLASTRDHSTGHYYHEGLAFRFDRQFADVALAGCHRETFEVLVTASLQELIQEIDTFLQSTRADPFEILDTWKKLQPYRLLIPEECDRVAREFFFSNFRLALAVLESRQVQCLRDS